MPLYSRSQASQYCKEDLSPGGDRSLQNARLRRPLDHEHKSVRFLQKAKAAVKKQAAATKLGPTEKSRRTPRTRKLTAAGAAAAAAKKTTTTKTRAAKQVAEPAGPAEGQQEAAAFLSTAPVSCGFHLSSASQQTLHGQPLPCLLIGFAPYSTLVTCTLPQPK